MESALLLTAAELRELRWLIDRTLASLRVELNHTDAHAFKQELTLRVNRIEAIARKLDEIEPAAVIG